ncbi:hypothetical protein IFVP18_C1240017 [Vibrio parahaemolyticus]
MVNEHKWQRGERAGDGPDQTGDEEHVAHTEFELGGSANRQTNEGGKVRDHNGLGEIEETARTCEESDQSRHVHKKGQFG